MTDATAGRAPQAAAQGPMLDAAGRPLKASLARALRAEKLRSLMLIAPLLAFVLVTFLFPIGDMLLRSVENQIVPNTLPKTVEALADWDPGSGELPGEPAFAALHDGPPRRRRGADQHPARLAAELRILRDVVADARRRPRRPADGDRPAVQGAVPRRRRQVGRPADLADHQAVLGSLHRRLHAERRRPPAHPGRPRGQAAGRADLHQALPAHRRDEPDDHLPLLPARLSGRLPSGEPAAQDLEPPADPRAAAVLDLAPRANRVLEGPPAAAGRHQRRPRLVRHHRQRRAPRDDQQRHRHDHRDDPHPPAVHDPAALLGDEDDPALLPARGEVARRQRLDRLLARLLPADRSRASAPAPSSSSSCRSATTSPPSSSAAPPASSSRTGSPTTSRPR